MFVEFDVQYDDSDMTKCLINIKNIIYILRGDGTIPTQLKMDNHTTISVMHNYERVAEMLGVKK